MTCTTLEHALAADKSDLRVQLWDGYGWTGRNAGESSTPLHALGLIVTSDGWTLGKAEPATTLTTIPGAAGSIDQTEEDPALHAYPGRRTVEINIAALGDPGQVQEGMANAGALHGALVRIQGLLPDPFLALEGRASLGEWTLNRRVDGQLVAAVGTLSIDAMPYAHGQTERVSLAAGTNNIILKGNAPIQPFVSLDSPSGSTAPASLTYYGTKRTQVLKSYQNSGVGWSFWCADRYSKARAKGGDTTDPKIGLALSADWMELPPGAIQLTCSTTGYLEYEPGYLF